MRRFEKRKILTGLAQRKPWLVAFTFGLLHGLGFAGGLSAAGLPAGHIPLALAFFSAGVEVGHFSFVATAVVSIAAARKWLKRKLARVGLGGFRLMRSEAWRLTGLLPDSLLFERPTKSASQFAIALSA